VNSTEPVLARRLQRASLACAAAAGAISVTALLGWALHLPLLVSIRPGLATMKVNTAVAVLLCAMASLLRERNRHDAIATHRRVQLNRLADGFALLSFAITAITLLQYLIDRDFGFDRLLYNDTGVPPHGHPGRMSIATASGIGLIAAGIFLLDRLKRISLALVSGGLAIGALGLLGYAYGFESLYRTAPFSSMAVNTAASICLLAISAMTARPRRYLHHLFLSNSSGGSVARRLLPATVLVPMALGWLCLAGIRAGYFEIQFGIAIFTLSTIVILAVLIWWNALLIDQTELHRRRVEHDRDGLLVREQIARARAEKALLARDQLLAMVSHELRTPLTPALLTATALEHRANLPIDVQEDLHLIHEQIEIEAHLIDDLLDMASLNQGKLVLNTQIVNVHDIARAAAALFGQQLAEKKISLSIELNSAEPMLRVDPKRFLQVMTHLFSNAIKFTPLGGKVMLKSFDTPGCMAFEVTDSGVGIQPETLSRIFDAFEQADPSTKRSFGGMGLGLTISRQLVQLHGGTLSAHSKGASQGASFVVELPRSTEGGKRPGAIREGAAEVAGLSILLVEDNAQSLWAMEQILASHGHEVVATANASDALTVANKRSFDLLISDLGLPDLSGWELMRRLRTSHAIPGIAVSGFVSAEDRAKSAHSGFRIHLDKPLDISQLMSAIEAIRAELSGPDGTPAH